MDHTPGHTPSSANDPLAGALVVVTRHHRRPLSAAALTAGLPLEHGRLTPALFIRAAERAGLAAGLVQRPLARLSARVLPAVLLLEDGDAVVLMAVDGDEATVVEPATGGGEVRLPVTELEAEYTGRALLARPAHRFAGPADESSPALTGHWFWSTLRRSWPAYAEVVVASLLINLFALATPLFVMNVYDRVVPNQAVETLWVLAIGVGIVLVFDFLMKAVRGYFIDMAGKRADILLSSHIFRHVLGVQLAARPGSVGAFANNLQEFESFRDFFTSATLATVIDLPFVLIFIAVIYAIGGPSLALLPAIAIPVVILTGLLLQYGARGLIERMFQATARRHAVLVETLMGLDTVKAQGAEGQVQRDWEQRVGEIARLGLKARFLSSGGVSFAQLVQQLTYVAVIVQGVYLIAAGSLTMGGLIACAILTGRALTPMGQVAGLLTRYHQSRAAYRTLDQIMALPEERPLERRFLHRDGLRGEIEFRDVTFRYPDQQVPALERVSLHIRPGQRVALVGPVGSGKSTVQRLLLKFYVPQEGNILVDGTDLNQLDPAEIRRDMGYVPQDITLVSGTVRDNIVYGNAHVDDEAVVRAARLAGIHDFLSRHPDGYDLQVGEQGRALSGGQRQGIAIARALLLDPPLLLLDEPTGSMDSGAEQRFLGRLLQEQAGRDRTLLLVTHRTTLLPLVDRLIVLDRGRVVADGPRDTVLQALSGNDPGRETAN
ncbi:MAG: type I secretion system permease/ATPase [Gammaproteobacteria bacterium]|nr:type I secretion system permease/ATPase [Gammaproteobacteria bacterium]